MRGILKDIILHKRVEVQDRKKKLPLSVLQRSQPALSQPRNFFDSLFSKHRASCSLIAEIKKASPSKGVLTKDFDPLHLAGIYEASGASALSILTDEQFFQGSLQFLPLVKIHSKLPILQKDFIIDLYQIYEARRWGADAILLIASILNDEEMSRFYQAARGLGLSTIIEVHNEEELDRALAVQPRIIGINNRNLQDFEISLETTRRLARQIPPEILVVSESGILNRLDVERVYEAGVKAILVGEALLTSPDISLKIKELLGR